ncbi:MAG: AAA family ATPase [Planctomycetaceae bacterium]
MYQPFFGLTRRPFSATPDINYFFCTETIDAARSALVNCLASGQGIAILTAPPGMGKTAFCQHLIAEFPAPFHVVFLSNSNFPTRRSLLQAMLFELGQHYSSMGEQELRLELTACLRTMHQQKQPVVLVVDEAHLLNTRVLEELRTITDSTVDGEPLVRLLLCGQLSLDEKLAHPSMEALNQRISTQVYLESFTRHESADYIAHRLSVAGSRIDDVFTPEALDIVVQASDGMPRCINQLCDHSLLLGYMVENKPIDAEVAREALDDLKQLPLHWNEPTAALTPLDQLRRQAGLRNDDDEDDEEKFAIESSSATSSLETGETTSATHDETYELVDAADSSVEAGDEILEWDETADAVPAASAAFEFGADEGEEISPPAVATAVPALRANITAKPVARGEWEEEVVVDHYSQLDAQAEQTGRKAFRTQYPYDLIAIEAANPPGIESFVPAATVDNYGEFIDGAIEFVFEEDETLAFIEAEYEPLEIEDECIAERVLLDESFIDMAPCVADIFQSIDETSAALQALIGNDMPAELAGQWDTFSVGSEHDGESASQDTDDFAFDAEDLADLDVPTQLVRALKAHAGAAGYDSSPEERIAREIIGLIDESKSFSGQPNAAFRKRPSTQQRQPEAPSPNAWFGSNDLYSDMQEFDPFDDESGFSSAKKFDVIQPDDGKYDEHPRSQPLFPPTFASTEKTASTDDRTYAPHPPEQPGRMISPKSFVRLFSELRKRQQRSA